MTTGPTVAEAGLPIPVTHSKRQIWKVVAVRRRIRVATLVALEDAAAMLFVPAVRGVDDPLNRVRS
ncbi:hypothetical protein GCM10009557_09530 [Virgisporangium ochraceum]